MSAKRPTVPCPNCAYPIPPELENCPSCGAHAEDDDGGRPDDVQRPLVGEMSPVQAVREAGKKKMAYGALWCIGGIGVTTATYGAAASSSNGGTYIVAWGAILYGVIQFGRGLNQWGGTPNSRSRQAPPPGSDLSALRVGLLSPDPTVRHRCATSIGDLGAAGADALPDLEKLRRDPTSRVRQRATWAVQTIRDQLRRTIR